MFFSKKAAKSQSDLHKNKNKETKNNEEKQKKNNNGILSKHETKGTEKKQQKAENELKLKEKKLEINENEFNQKQKEFFLTEKEEELIKKNEEDIAKENKEGIAKENEEDLAKENKEDLSKGDEEDLEKDMHILPLQRMTSRAALVKENSALILRGQTSPTILKKFSGIHIFPENDELVGIYLYYYTGWDSANIHYKINTDKWTDVPGMQMHLFCKNKNNENELSNKEINVNNFDDAKNLDINENNKLEVNSQESSTGKAINKEINQNCVKLPTFFNSEENIFMAHISLNTLEFVINHEGRFWDKAPGNKNYIIDDSGYYYLRQGNICEILPIPDKPILLRASKVGCSYVCLQWNPPLLNAQLVAKYFIYRDGVFIAEVGENVGQYIDRDLLGLSTYEYKISAVNKQMNESLLSSPCIAQTCEPGKPSAPRDLKFLTHSSSMIELSWLDPVDNGGAVVQFFRIYRNDLPYAVVQVNSGGKVHKWRDDLVEKGETYEYCVSACHSLDAPFKLSSFFPAFSKSDLLCDAQDVKLVQPTNKSFDKVQKNSIASFKTEGILSDKLKVQAIDMLEMPRIYDGKTHIILQAFNWKSCENKDGWYKVLCSKIKKFIEAKVTMIWLPPPSKSVSGQGYMPTKWYDLDTLYGTKEELKKLNKILQENSIASMIDLVVNHRCGSKKNDKGEWTIFEDPDWSSWAIVSNNLQGYHGSGKADTGAQSKCAPDIDHTNPQVQKDVKLFLNFLFKKINFNAIRIDMAPGYNVKYQIDYINSVGTPFSVGEYWNGNKDVLLNYVYSAKRSICAFDFAFYYVLRRCIETGTFSEMKCGNRLNGLVGKDSDLAVTFLDNHDTEHLDFVGLFAQGNTDAILRGYAILLTHPGTPCIYWNHFLDYGDYCFNKIKELSEVRHNKKIYSGSGIHITRAEHGLYAAYISDQKHCGDNGGVCAVKVGWGDWCPPKNSNWSVYTYGNGYCVWVR